MSPIKPENKARYPKSWRGISNRIKERAGWQCECVGECGLHEGERCDRTHNQILRSDKLDEWGVPKWFYVVLTVAHLDHTPENCEDDNLKAMCQRCHNRYDRPHRTATIRRAKEQGTDPLFEEIA